MYCHDNEHENHLEAAARGPAGPSALRPAATHNPFADLKARLAKKGK